MNIMILPEGPESGFVCPLHSIVNQAFKNCKIIVLGSKITTQIKLGLIFLTDCRRGAFGMYSDMTCSSPLDNSNEIHGLGFNHDTQDFCFLGTLLEVKSAGPLHIE
jgi:hypothetical protein